MVEVRESLDEVRAEIDRIDREALTRDGVAVRARADDATAIELVACGQALPGHEIRIVDETGRELDDRREGLDGAGEVHLHNQCAVEHQALAGLVQ